MASLRKRAILAGSILVLAALGGAAIARTPALHGRPAATVLATDSPQSPQPSSGAQSQPEDQPDTAEAPEPAESEQPDGPNDDVEANDGD
jgi:hypothetical protein